MTTVVQKGFPTPAGDETSSEDGDKLNQVESRIIETSEHAEKQQVQQRQERRQALASSSTTIHREGDWRDFFERLCFAATRLGRIQAKVKIPDIIFIEKTWTGTENPLVWYSQQTTHRGVGIYRVLSTQTNSKGILSQLAKHLSLLLGALPDGTPRHACVATFQDRQEILTYAKVEAMLSEIQNINLENPPSSQEGYGTVYGRPPHFPFCISFLAPPKSGSARYISSSVANDQEGLLLGAVSQTARAFDYFQRRGMARRPPEWNCDEHQSEITIKSVDSTTQRLIAVGMRQLCRSLVLQRKGIDLTKDLDVNRVQREDPQAVQLLQRHTRLINAATDVQGVILEFTQSTDGLLWFSGIVSITKMKRKANKSLPQSLSTMGGMFCAESNGEKPEKQRNSASLIYEDQPSSSGSHHVPVRPSSARNVSRKTPRSSTASVFDPHTGMPLSITRRVGGGHSYVKQSGTLYTPVNRSFTPPSRQNVKSILLAHGARHCAPPALVAMGHRIDKLMGQLEGEIQRGKALEGEVEERDHTISVIGDHASQLRHRIAALEQELSATRQQFATREADLLRDLHNVRGSLDDMTKEKGGLENTLIAVQHKLEVLEATAKDERGSLVNRMVEYDEAARKADSKIRKLEAGIAERDNEIVKLTEELSKERSASDSLKESLRDLKENFDSMGASHDMAVSEMKEYKSERNDLFRNSGEHTSRLRFGRGKPFKLYAWDILATHPNPRAELEIVFSVFHHYNVEIQQIYVHYASHAAPIFNTLRQRTSVPAKRVFKEGGSTSRSGAGSGLKSVPSPYFGPARGKSSESGRLRLLMTRSDFRSFARDTGICDPPLFPVSFVDLCFDKAILGGTRKGGREVILEGVDGKTSRGGFRPDGNRHRMIYSRGGAGRMPSCEKIPNGTMTRREFKEALLRLAHARFSKLENIADKISLMIEEHIIPGCQAALNLVLEDDDCVRLNAECQKSGYGV